VQDLLVVAVGKFVVVIDVSHVAAPGPGFNVDVPVECRMESPVRGVYVIGQHDDDVTELASCASGATSLATASKDGTVSLDNRSSRHSDVWLYSQDLVASSAYSEVHKFGVYKSV
jgi:hypothetical protein